MLLGTEAAHLHTDMVGDVADRHAKAGGVAPGIGIGVASVHHTTPVKLGPDIVHLDATGNKAVL